MTRSVALAGTAQVSLWLCTLEAMPGPDALARLGDAELDRARRFVAERDRRRYLAARCALREHLSQHTGLPGECLRIVEGEFGKPRLADRPGSWFNLSHSGDAALLGISKAGEVGVDLEVRHPVDDVVALARRHFSGAEFEAFMGLDAPARNDAFLRVWTRKEACLKAVGTGLSIEPASLEVGLDGGPVRLALRVPCGLVQVEVCSIDPGIDAWAALARVL